MGNFNNENLIPFTGELKPGQRLLKRPDGYFIPVGASAGSNVVAGYFADKDGNGLKFYPVGSNNGESVNQIMIADTGENEPEYEGGNSIDFYKCTSVDTTNQTWTGYKAIFNSTTGIYSFQGTVTSELIYSVIIPKIGNVYTDGALVDAKLFTGIPTDYVVYHPLSSAEAIVSGYNCSYSNVTFAQDSSLGETVAVFNGNGRLTISNVAGSPAIAFSIFQKVDTNTGDAHMVVMRNYFGILSTPSNTGVFDFNGNLELEKQYSNTGWHHIYADYANGVTRLFIDGVEAANTTSYTDNYNYTSNVQMGVHLNESAFPLTGKLKAFRMYTRQLSVAEIAALATEFIPTQS